jgi:membrane fusion protein, heavy metal efflux system
MKSLAMILALLATAAIAILAQEPSPRSDNTVVIDAVAEANLGIHTEEAGEAVFSSILTVPGVVEHTCESHSIVSSSIEGRFVEVLVHEGEFVEANQLVARVESRQPGDPPPVVELRAPAPGLVVRSQIHLGGPVEPGVELMEILDLSTVWTVPALGDEVRNASYVRPGVGADAAKGFMEAVFELSNPGNRLRPGMRADVAIVVDERSGVLSVPRVALQGDRTHRFVFIRDYEFKHGFVRVPVEVGEISAGRVEIISGLFPGDEVVTAGAYELAFAGKGSASLKEALDAAHGHPHNEDGSEMTAEQIAAAKGAHGHDHGHASHAPIVWFLAVACGALLLLLIATPIVLRRRSSQA